jgi:hypothetical protein
MNESATQGQPKDRGLASELISALASVLMKIFNLLVQEVSAVELLNPTYPHLKPALELWHLLSIIRPEM